MFKEFKPYRKSEKKFKKWTDYSGPPPVLPTTTSIPFYNKNKNMFRKGDINRGIIIKCPPSSKPKVRKRNCRFEFEGHSRNIQGRETNGVANGLERRSEIQTSKKEGEVTTGSEMDLLREVPLGDANSSGRQGKDG